MGKGTLIIGFSKPAREEDEAEGHETATLAFAALRKALASKDDAAGVEAFRELMACCQDTDEPSDD